jgi:hypothetical protein
LLVAQKLAEFECPQIQPASYLDCQTIAKTIQSCKF